MLQLLLTVTAAALALWGGTAAAEPAPSCPLLGPLFPKPTKLRDSALMQDVFTQLTAGYDGFIADNADAANKTSWAVEIYSADDPEPLWSHYHTQGNLATLDSPGVNTVDANTVFRLGSVTKVFSVYTWLLEEGDRRWNDPVTLYVPELAAIAADGKGGDPLTTIDWESITIGALASQLSGIPRDYSFLGELSIEVGEDKLVQIGFPRLSNSTRPPCGQRPQCDRAQFFTGLAKMHPSFSADYGPAYSDIAYNILAYALENITSRAFPDMVKEDVIGGLALENTYYTAPNSSKGIIPGNVTETGWIYSLGEENPAGGMYSSSHDLSAFGRAILSFRQLPAPLTRRWLRPATYTSDPAAALAAPWGLRRIPLGAPYQSTVAYQKAAAVGAYTALMILLPDFDAGLTVLLAGDSPANFHFDVADTLGAAVVPALLAAARAGAEAAYAGTFVGASGGQTGGDGDGSSSSIVLSAAGDDGGPGIAVDSWVSNGTDMAQWAVRLHLQTREAVNASVRLYPTGLEAAAAAGGRRVALKAVFQAADAPARSGYMFSTDCATWLPLTSEMYGSLALDEFIVTLDEGGRAVAVEPVALRVKLERQASD